MIQVPRMSNQTNHGTNTARFLSLIDVATRNAILDNVAGHYGINRDLAREEITHDEAEHLLDYVTGPQRAATSVLMQRHLIPGPLA